MHEANWNNIKASVEDVYGKEGKDLDKEIVSGEVVGFAHCSDGITLSYFTDDEKRRRQRECRFGKIPPRKPN